MHYRTKTTELAYVVNKSITQTLTRSIYTSLTTFISIAVLYVLGVSSIKEFALPLMVGIVVRSLFIRMYHRRSVVCDEDPKREEETKITDRIYRKAAVAIGGWPGCFSGFFHPKERAGEGNGTMGAAA